MNHKAEEDALRVLLLHPWGGFDPAYCGAGRVACAHLNYFQRAGWKVECVLLEIPAWGITAGSLAAITARYPCVQSIRTLSVACPRIGPRCYGDEFSLLLDASDRAARSAAFRTIAREKWDAFFTTDVVAAPFALGLPRSTRKVLAVDDSYARRAVATELGSNALREAEARFVFGHIETELYRVFDRVLFCAEEDVLAAQRSGVKAAIQVPPFIREPDKRARRETESEHDLLICGGTRSGEVADVDWFYRHVYLPHLRFSGVRLTLVGPVAEHFHVADAHVTKLARRTDAYHSARLVVAPVCEAVGPCMSALDALAAGRAVVSTPLGVRGVELPPDAAVIIEMRRDPVGTAAVIRNLLATPGWRRILGERATQVQKQYTHERFLAALDAAWDRPARSRRLEEVF